MTMDWLSRWEANQDAHEAELARAADDSTPDLVAHGSQVARHKRQA